MSCGILKHTASISAKAVESIVKGVEIDKIMGFGCPGPEQLYATTAKEVSKDFIDELDDLGIKARLWSNDDDEELLLACPQGISESRRYDKTDDSEKFMRVKWYVVEDELESNWLVIVRVYEVKTSSSLSNDEVFALLGL